MYLNFFLPLHDNVLPLSSIAATDTDVPSHNYQSTQKIDNNGEPDTEAAVASEARRHSMYRSFKSDMASIIVAVLLTVIFLPITVIAALATFSTSKA